MITGKVVTIPGGQKPTLDIDADAALDPDNGILYRKQGSGWDGGTLVGSLEASYVDAAQRAAQAYADARIGQVIKAVFNYEYDFSIDGGNTGFVNLRGIGNPRALPSNFVMTLFVLDVLTALDSSTHMAKGGFSIDSPPMSAGNVLMPAVVSGAPWNTVGVTSVAADEFPFQFSNGADGVHFDVSIENLTQGKFKVHIEGYIEP